MKTQIITLESHDDLISVRDKLSWAKTPRILLVWPKYEKVTLRLLDLKVLQRHAVSLGAQLGLVTRRANVRRDAESLAIPVFDSTAAAQKDLWPLPASKSPRTPRAPRRDLRQIRDDVYEREPAWRTSLVGRIAAFAVGVSAVLAVAGLFVPRATVTLFPESQVQSAIIPVAASESVGLVSITGSVPARKLSVTVSAEQSLATASEIAVPNSKAKGIARFSNLTENEVNIPAGTVIATESDVPIRYVTLHQTLLDPGTDQFVDIPIEALQSGSSGNVPVDQIAAVEGEIGLSISVTNPNLVSGGTDTRLVGATDADRGELREAVIGALDRDAESKLREQITDADVLLMDTFEVSQIIAETYDPPVGQGGKTLVLSMQVEYSARYVSEEDLGELSLAALNLAVPSGFQPFGIPAYRVLDEPASDASGVSRFELEVTRMLLRQTNESQVFSIARGHDPVLAAEELTTRLSLREEPEISLMPAWWPWMPLIPFNISVEAR